jgi:hypothetical protein
MWEKVLSPKGGANAKGLSSSSFLAINAKGEKVLSPKQKDRTTISNWIFQKEVFFNWYLILSS